MLDDQLLLRALRGEVAVADVCAAANVGLAEFRQARDANLRRRLPPTEIRLGAPVRGTVEVFRDGRGIPHVYATATPDLYFGLGLAMAQDRLWQMDFFRRRGRGTLAEVLGPAYLQSDVAHRTLGLDRMAESEASRIDLDTAAVLEGFVAGINRWLDQARGNMPIEFDLLNYEPGPWSVADVLVALRGFWWSLNGRIQSIVVAEAAKLLPTGPLRDTFLTPNLADERILPPDAPYPPADSLTLTLSQREREQKAGPRHLPANSDDRATWPPSTQHPEPRTQHLSGGSDDGTTGSNNWAVGRGRTPTGAGLLGSDPHQPFGFPANWYECRLVGPEDDVAGAAWAGLPGIWFGRNRQIAWGLTNNGVSLRDLYVEEVDPTDRSRYRDGDGWRRFDERRSDIAVRGQATPERLVVRETIRGPIVNRLIPSVHAEGDPPLSLRWVGLEPLDDVRALLAVGRARNWIEFRAALRDWAIPTFNWGYADVEGNVGYQCASRLPVRGRPARGFRQANEPADQWQGYLPFEAQPYAYNPARGFTASANQAPVPDDYPYPYDGAFAPGERAIRIREEIEQSPTFDRAACAALQNDTLSAPARQLVPPLLRRLASSADPDAVLARQVLTDWDYRYETASVAPAIFELFLAAWKRRVAEERFPAHLVPLATGQGSSWACLIEDDDLAWFQSDKQEAIVTCARAAVDQLRARFGADPTGWTWGQVHLAHFRHPLSNSATADAFDVGPLGVSGTASTVRNTGVGSAPILGADSGAEYRLIADLADDSQIWATQNMGQSAQPGSPHYQDQFAVWARGDYHVVRLKREDVVAEQTARVLIEPA
jgi:penicillin amidase